MSVEFLNIDLFNRFRKSPRLLSLNRVIRMITFLSALLARSSPVYSIKMSSKNSWVRYFFEDRLAAVSYIGLVDQLLDCQIGENLRRNFIRTDVYLLGQHPSVYPIWLLQVAILFLCGPAPHDIPCHSYEICVCK
jgi:hypothetical protein